MVRQKLLILAFAAFPVIAMGHTGDHGEMTALEFLTHHAASISVGLALAVSILGARSLITRRRVVRVRD